MIENYLLHVSKQWKKVFLKNLEKTKIFFKIVKNLSFPPIIFSSQKPNMIQTPTWKWINFSNWWKKNFSKMTLSNWHPQLLLLIGPVMIFRFFNSMSYYWKWKSIWWMFNSKITMTITIKKSSSLAFISLRDILIFLSWKVIYNKLIKKFSWHLKWLDNSISKGF